MRMQTPWRARWAFLRMIRGSGPTRLISGSCFLGSGGTCLLRLNPFDHGMRFRIARCWRSSGMSKLAALSGIGLCLREKTDKLLCWIRRSR